jgi:hypothetical protein
MASLWVRVCCAGYRIASAVLVAAIAFSSAGAENGKTLPDVPRFKLFASSHATAAAEVLAFHGVRKGLPEVVLIGGLEGRIYRCDCGKDIETVHRCASAYSVRSERCARLRRVRGDVDVSSEALAKEDQRPSACICG